MSREWSYFLLGEKEKRRKGEWRKGKKEYGIGKISNERNEQK